MVFRDHGRTRLTPEAVTPEARGSSWMKQRVKLRQKRRNLNDIMKSYDLAAQTCRCLFCRDGIAVMILCDEIVDGNPISLTSVQNASNLVNKMW